MDKRKKHQFSLKKKPFLVFKESYKGRKSNKKMHDLSFFCKFTAKTKAKHITILDLLYLFEGKLCLCLRKLPYFYENSDWIFHNFFQLCWYSPPLKCIFKFYQIQKFWIFDCCQRLQHDSLHHWSWIANARFDGQVPLIFYFLLPFLVVLFFLLSFEIKGPSNQQHERAMLSHSNTAFSFIFRKS